jgi:tetratricopeptide (TPR) repeat protein
LTASVASFLSKAQRKGTELPPAVSGALLLAAVRLSDAKGQAVRAYQLLVDDGGGIDLLTGEPPTGDGYAAPELRNGAVLPDDPRVLVYAAGALGYELVTLTPPQAGLGVGPEVHGPLAKVIRKAMAERQKRFKNLTEMARAIEAIHGRPTKEEEQLILAAVAASTPLPPAQKLAKLELEKAAAPEATAPARGDEDRSATQPVFTQIWDPLEGSPEPEITAPPPAEERPRERQEREPLRTELQLERQARAELSATVESRGEHLSQLGTRLSLLEEQVRTSLPPPLSPAEALLREVNQLLERRRFAEAERVLRDPVVENDALLQLRLGQALSSMSDSGASGLARADAAFRRAAELDPGWAEPRAQLGILKSRQGRRKEARAEFQTALKLDPACPEALAALARPGRGAAGFALSGAGGALAAALLVLAVQLPPKQAAPQPGPRIEVASPAPAPAAIQPPAPIPAAARPAAPAREPEPRLPPLPLPERKPGPAAETEPSSQAVRVPRPEPKTRARKVASPARAAAEEEVAKGDKALRAFDTNAAQAAFASALKLDPTLAAAHRGMGMVYVLLGKNAEAKAEYARYLDLAPDAPDKDQIARLVSR